jgi:alpha-galactosidase
MEEHMLSFQNSGTSKEKLDKWLETAFTQIGYLPISFSYDKKSSSILLREWKKTETALSSYEKSIVYEASDGMRAIIDVRLFPGFPVVEWLLSFENVGEKNSKLLENVRAMNICIECSPFRTAGTRQFGAHDNILHYSGGSDCKIDDFIPLKEVLHFICNTEKMHFESVGGRPTSGSHGAMPYFNIQTQQNGAILALGWSGQWEMDVLMRQREDEEQTFESLAGMPMLHENSKPCFRFIGGMPDIHLVLYPGERIRSPRALMMPWVGDIQDAHNTFRSFMLEYHTPKINNQIAQLPINTNAWGTNELQHIADIDATRKSELPLDTYWVDAGWYGPAGTKCDDPENQDWAKYVGYWDCDPTRYPNGFKPVSDYARKNNMRFLLWMEPDRAVYGTPSTIDHPEYFLGKREEGESLLFNLGDPDGWQWMYTKLCEKIDEYGIDILRIDYNYGNPLERWNENDEDNRRGMTQIRAVEGLYKLWDALLLRYKNLLIDNCASGGRRLDFEALTRSVPLFRSDYACYADNDPIGMQVQTGGLSLYIPVSATSFGKELDWYRFRSTLSQGMNFSSHLINEASQCQSTRDELGKMINELLRIRDLYNGDYYALTGVTIDRRDWFAYEVHRKDLSCGAIVSIRRDESPFVEGVFTLKGLDPMATYCLEDADTGETWCSQGSELMSDGLKVRIENKRQARVIFFSC